MSTFICPIELPQCLVSASPRHARYGSFSLLRGRQVEPSPYTFITTLKANLSKSVTIMLYMIRYVERPLSWCCQWWIHRLESQINYQVIVLDPEEAAKSSYY